MRPSVAAVAALVTALVPGDVIEAEQRADTLAWLAATDDVYRRSKPATPPRHLVSYVVPIDPDDGAILLVDHVNAGLWLPPGGHVEPDEDPAETARREAAEELGLTSGCAATPTFLTVTRTVGADAGHDDVSLWFTATVRRSDPLVLDPDEFRGAHWWSPAELDHADPTRFDPHLARFRRKLAGKAEPVRIEAP